MGKKQWDLNNRKFRLRRSLLSENGGQSFCPALETARVAVGENNWPKMPRDEEVGQGSSLRTDVIEAQQKCADE
jgi:hypothetical protein